MDKLVELFISNPLSAISVVMFALLAWFIKRDYARRENQFKRFGATFSNWEKELATQAAKTKTALSLHSEDMGKATKAINGDMLEIKKEFFQLKQELFEKMGEAQNAVSHIEREAKALIHGLQMAVEKLEGKFGKVSEYKEEIEKTWGKIYSLEENTGKLEETVNKGHRNNFRALAKALKSQQSEIETLKKASKKNEV